MRRSRTGMAAGALLVVLATLAPSTVNSQVLIALLFGDALNTGKVEFGLDGGVNFASMDGIAPSDALTTWNLGFYFDIRLADSTAWILHTGVIVKSSMGADGTPVYPLGDPELDASFAGGRVATTLRYFDVPVMAKYRFPSNVYLEGGAMAGLLYGATDEFIASVSDEDDLTYRRDVHSAYHPLDAGLMVGAGYRLLGGDGINLGVRYYYGLVDVLIDDSGPSRNNRSLYLTVGIPIGAAEDDGEEVSPPK